MGPYSGQYGKWLWSRFQLLGSTSCTWIKPVLEFYLCPLAVLQRRLRSWTNLVCQVSYIWTLLSHRNGVIGIFHCSASTSENRWCPINADLLYMYAAFVNSDSWQPLSIAIVPLAGRVGYHLGGVRWLALRDTDACIGNTECVECEQAMLGCELYIMALTDWELSITRHMVLWWTGHSVSVISRMYVCIVRRYMQCTCTCAVLV